MSEAGRENRQQTRRARLCWRRAVACKRNSPTMILELFLVLSASAPQDTPPPATEPKLSIEDEVLGNVKAQPIGPATVDDLAFPDAYLKRVSDRIIRSSFESRYRIVVPDPAPAAVPPPPPPAAPAKATPPPATKSEGISLPFAIGTAVFLALAVIIFVARRQRGGAR